MLHHNAEVKDLLTVLRYSVEGRGAGTAKTGERALRKCPHEGLSAAWVRITVVHVVQFLNQGRAIDHLSELHLNIRKEPDEPKVG